MKYQAEVHATTVTYVEIDVPDDMSDAQILEVIIEEAKNPETVWSEDQYRVLLVVETLTP